MSIESAAGITSSSREVPAETERCFGLHILNNYTNRGQAKPLSDVVEN